MIMIVVCFILSCLSSFVLGGLFIGVLVIKYYEGKFFTEFTRFENRVDFSFDKYFGFPLFPKKDN